MVWVKPVSKETAEIATLILIIGFWVMLLVVCPLSYWMGKRSVKVDPLDYQPPVDHTHGKDPGT